jgi:hypothetical protein
VQAQLAVAYAKRGKRIPRLRQAWWSTSGPGELRDIPATGSSTWEGASEEWTVTRPDDDFLAGVERFAEPRRREPEHSSSVFTRARGTRGRVTGA